MTLIVAQRVLVPCVCLEEGDEFFLVAFVVSRVVVTFHDTDDCLSGLKTQVCPTDEDHFKKVAILVERASLPPVSFLYRCNS